MNGETFMLQRLCIRFLGLALLLLALAPGAVRADTPIALFKSYAGNLNFTGTQKTMRTASNATNACSVNTGTLSMVLAGVPAGSTIVSAHLYWAGSNSVALADYNITFEGGSVVAPAERRYSTNSTGTVYFSGAADVTAQVAAKGNGTYSVGGLTIDTSATYCNSEAVLGGFSLLVVYSNPNQTFRVLNLYEGFQYIRTFEDDNVSVAITLSNFKIPSPMGSATGRIGHITWEGDASLLGTGEELRYNGYEMIDTSNPTGNQFNSVSNINGDNASYGIDFDAYTLSSPVIQSGQTSGTTTYKSGQDQVLMSAEIIAIPNVPVADLVLSLTRSGVFERGQAITYTLAAGNAGPGDELGPTTITTTLPAGLTYTGATGAGWTCNTSGQTLTCTRAGTITQGAVVPPLVLSLVIDADAPSVMVTSATIAGTLFDNVPANNTVTDTISFASDLAISMALVDPPLMLGQNTAYRISVVNNGPYQQDGPVAVTTTLPATLRYLSGAGGNWQCSANGQVVTCSSAGVLAVGQTTPDLNLFVVVQSSATSISVTATADGTGTDNTLGNNSVTVTSTMGVPGFVFTDSACIRDRAFGLSTQTCKVLGATNRIAGEEVELYITNVNASGVPTRYSTNTTNVTLGFALSCHNPTTGNGTLPVFVGNNLGACVANGATTGTFTNFSVPFPANSPSAGLYGMVYNDTGRVEFLVRDGSNRLGSTGQYVYRPQGFTLATTVTNPYASNASLGAGKFAVAGASFGLTVTATTITGAAARNYGREASPEGVRLTATAAFESGATPYPEMVNVPAISGEFGGFVAGVATGSAFTFDEVGVIRLVPSVKDGDFLVQGQVTGSALALGRFVPAWFNTEVPMIMECTSGMIALAPCEAGTGMHYSKQPIGTTVRAVNQAGAVTRNYQQRLARSVTMSAAAARGGSVHPASAGALSATALAASEFEEGVAKVEPVFTLAAAAAPLTVHLRAIESTGSDGVSSLRGAIPSPASVEGQTRIALGRLQVSNIYGSELLALRVPLQAQVWTGTRWENNLKDAVSTVTVTSAAMSFTSCKNNLASSCSAPTLAPLAAVGVQVLAAGKYTLTLKAPGRIGSANLQMTSTSPWLPSTTGRVTFGVYKATPLIYIRELF